MPARLGRYAVRRRIGAGAFATVWLAYDEQLDSAVAIKVLAENWSEDLAVRQRFLEEGRFLRKVESPHVVTVYDAGELDDGRPYLVMSYADQGTLADRLEIDGLTAAQVLEVVREIGAGLQTLHERGVLHRDLKPANVLFRAVDGRVRAMVADLGLGKSMEVSSRLTVIAGTPSFVAPEQAQGEPLDPRADLYSLAALTYLMLTGRTPFRHASLSDAMHPGDLPPVSTPDRPFPPQVEQVLRRGMSRSRDDRFPDVTAFVTALEAALGPDAQGPTTQPWLDRDPELTQPGPRPSLEPAAEELPQPRPPRRRRRILVLALVGVLALVVGGGAGYAAQRGLAPTERTVDDDTGTLTVTVPADWDRADSTDGWEPPNAEGSQFPALSAGTAPEWADSDEGEGVFVALLPGTVLPQQVPQHPECADAGRAIRDTSRNGDESTTVFYADCPGGVVVERVVLLTANTLLWVQVRSHGRATANRVLDDVETHGI